jgi:hypothetical protein
MKKIIVTVSLFFLTSCATQTGIISNGQKVMYLKLKIASGEVVTLPMPESGPIPAEKNGLKIEVAGFLVKQNESNKRLADFIWQFALSKQDAINVSEITIEELYPSDDVKLLVNVKNPKFINSIFLINLDPIEASQYNTPWLYSNTGSLYLFRFTVISNNNEETVLLQPAWFSVDLTPLILPVRG